MISIVENRDCMEAMREFPDKYFELAFDFWGYELDKEYFDASVKRFEQHKAQLNLFK
jgi:DNA modification methylase